MRVIVSPFGEGVRNIISEEIDAEVAKLARAVNGGLDVGNLARSTKFSPTNDAGAVPYAFLEPYSIYCLQATGSGAGTMELGALSQYHPGGVTSILAYAHVNVPAYVTSVAFKINGTTIVTITPTALSAWDSKLGPDGTVVSPNTAVQKRRKTGKSRSFLTTISSSSQTISAVVSGTPTVGINAYESLRAYAALYLMHVHYS